MNAEAGTSTSADLGIVFAGGGTGGHIHPGLAVAETLEAMAPGRTRCVFVVSDRAIDARVLDAERLCGEPIERMVSPARPLAFAPSAIVKFALRWGAGVRAGREAVAMLRGCGRVAMLATGGFVSAPAIMGARAEGIERWVVTLDAVPGKANRLAERFATRGYRVGTGEGRIPPIVRARMRDLPSPAHARLALGLDAGRRTLLISGGSQGAGSVNGFVLETLRRSPELFDGWQVIHQAGGSAGTDREQLLAAWSDAGVPSLVEPYIERMDLALASADAAIGRAGAGTVAALWATGVRALLLPYPHHADGHQRLNAGPLVEAGGAMIATDFIDPARNADAHGEALAALLDIEEGAQRREAMQSLGPADGADRLARDLLALL